MSQEEMASVTKWATVTVTVTSMADSLGLELSLVSSLGRIRVGELYQVNQNSTKSKPAMFPLLGLLSSPICLVILNSRAKQLIMGKEIQSFSVTGVDPYAQRK